MLAQVRAGYVRHRTVPAGESAYRAGMFQLFRRKSEQPFPASGDRRRQKGHSGEGALSALDSLRRSEQSQADNYPQARLTAQPAALSAATAGDVKQDGSKR